MKHFIALISFLFLVSSCNQKKAQQTPDEANSKLKLTFKVIPEMDNTFCVEWQDTLGLADSHIRGKTDFIKRPKEIWCVVTDSQNDTLGYYKGLSTAQIYTCFETKDSIVFLNFMIGLNLFSDKTSQIKSEDELTEYLKLIENPVKYNPVMFDISKDLGKEIEIELNRVEQ